MRPGFFDEGRARDPIDRFVAWLREHDLLDDERLDAVDAEVRRVVDDATDEAERSPFPDGPDALRGVHAG